MPIVCPIDGKDDAIQKVSALVSAGKSTGSFSGPTGGIAHIGGEWGTVGGFSRLKGGTITDLAKMLTPPKKPNRPRTKIIGCSILLFMMMVYGWFLLFCAFMFFFTVISFMPNILVEGLYDPSISNPDIAAIIMYLTMLFLVIIVTIVFGILFKMMWSSRNKTNTRSNKQYENDLILWKQAMLRWENLYYCFRHDIVFNPATGESVKPRSIRQYLFG